MNCPPLVIVGAGGHGKVVLDAARSAGVAVHCFLDQAELPADQEGVRVVRLDDFLSGTTRVFYYVVAIGENRRRAELFRMLRGRGGRPFSIMHRNSVVAPNARLGAGGVCCAGSVINPRAVVGENVIVNTCASIDHDCTVGDHVHVAPGARLAGRVTVGDEALIGIGSVVMPSVRIGKRVLLGAGSVANRDLPDEVVAFGVPARIQRRPKVDY